MEVLILILSALISNVTPFNFVEDPNSIHSCEIGDVIQNGQVTCTCAQNHVYECIFKTMFKSHPDLKHLNNTFACQPNKIYVEDTTTCICNKDGTWPHKACGDVFNSLPAEDVVKTKCERNGYVFIGCNVCRCNNNGYLDKSRCTKNDCHKPVKSSVKRRSASNVYGNCEAKNWYSLAPCQFCFCLNENKLVCNTGNYNVKKLQLGSYNLSVCGKELIREAIELIPNDDKLLRQREEKFTIPTSTKPTTTRRPTVVNYNSNIEFEVSGFQEKISKETTEKRNTGSLQTVNYDDNEANYDEGSKIESTKIPYQEDYQFYSKESEEIPAERDDEEDVNTDNEILDSGLQIPLKSDTVKKHKTPRQATLKNLDDLGKQLKASLPMMLGKVFKMALRKSMVTIDKDSNCVPGSVNTIKCNTCFCLKNSKLLCTNNKCNKMK